MTDNLTPEDQIEIIKQEIAIQPEILLEDEYLEIKDKKAQKVSFQLNHVQTKLHDFIMKNQGKHLIKIIVLKARKQGISTYVAGLFYAWTSQTENTETVVVAHESDSVSYLFNIYKYFHDNFSVSDWKFMSPEVVKNNAKQLEFAGKNSTIFVKVASGGGVGRSFTPRLVHCSEVAFFKNPEAVFDGLNNSIPDENNVVEILESTANGVGNYFHRQWQLATDIDDWNGEGYARIFFAWFDSPENRTQLREGEKIEFTGLYAIELIEMSKRYSHLDDEQLKWYIRTLVDKCGNDLDVMRQEHPSNAEEAFIASGNPIFNTKLLYKMLDYENIQHGNNVYKKYDIIEEYNEFKLDLGNEQGRYGQIDIYQLPLTNYQYILGCDVAEGVEGGDSSICNVINIMTGEQAAHIKFDGDVGKFASLVYKLAMIYNRGLVAPERNNHGHAMIIALKEVHKYSNIYVFELDKKEGLPTNQLTRVQAIANLNKYLNDGYYKIHNVNTIQELLSFVNYKGKAQATMGCHDDEVASLWVCSYVLNVGLLQKVATSQGSVNIAGGMQNTLAHKIMQIKKRKIVKKRRGVSGY